jgi:hypothetical protein
MEDTPHRYMTTQLQYTNPTGTHSVRRWHTTVTNYAYTPTCLAAATRSAGRPARSSEVSGTVMSVSSASRFCY